MSQALPHPHPLVAAAVSGADAIRAGERRVGEQTKQTVKDAIMSHMTKLPGVPDRDDIRPGMAYFAGTGPQGKTCGDCAHHGYQREVISPRPDGSTAWHHKYHGGCRRYKQLAGHDGPVVKKAYPACREFHQKEKGGAS
jgi:hypothetical protein